MLNSCNFAGRLVDDPKLFDGKNPRACFTLAVDRDFIRDDDKADYFDFVAWNERAEYIVRHFRKGDMVLVSSRAKVRAYEDSNGARKRKTEFEAERIYCICRSRENVDEQ